jgi:hypothetical protein
MTAFRTKHPPPWRVEEIPGGFKVCDVQGCSLAYVYAADDGRTSSHGKLSPAEAKTLANAIAELPELWEVLR